MSVKKTEHLIDVYPSRYGDAVFVYDLSSYFRASRGKDRSRYVDSCHHIISGENNVVFIIDLHEVLTDDTAKRLVRKWYGGDIVRHRLD